MIGPGMGGQINPMMLAALMQMNRPQATPQAPQLTAAPRAGAMGGMPPMMAPPVPQQGQQGGAMGGMSGLLPLLMMMQKGKGGGNPSGNAPMAGLDMNMLQGLLPGWAL